MKRVTKTSWYTDDGKELIELNDTRGYITSHSLGADGLRQLADAATEAADELERQRMADLLPEGVRMAE